MFYRNNKGEKIFIVNPKKPRNLSRGGLIKGHPDIPKKHLDEDTILSDLEVGSLVVPVPVMKKNIMKNYDGKITGNKQTDKSKLVRAIVMPNELVVHKNHAPKVERFLAKKGIKLPFGK